MSLIYVLTPHKAEQRRKKSQRAEVLTSSPYNKALDEKKRQPEPLKRKQQVPASSELKKNKTVKTMNDPKPPKSKKSRKQKEQAEDKTPCGICKL